jgi:hypothetical protein
MVVHYWCSSCSRVLFVTKALSECAKDCPAPDTGDAPPQALAADARFLHSMGIAVPE